MPSILDKPPYCNTGAENTNQSGLRACVDWVQATFKNLFSYQELVDILGLKSNEFYDCGGMYGYKSGLRFGHIAIFYDGNAEMGIHLEMSGQGCREYESYNQLSWKELFLECFRHDAHFSRLDVAVDDFRGYFTISSLKRRIKNRECISKFKNAISIEKLDLESGDSKGETIYFGSASSRLQVRMYEKNHERQGKGFELEEGLDVWNRVELQTRNERSETIATLIATDYQELGKMVCGILKHYIRFAIPDKKDSNRSRWKTAKFWEKFLGQVEKLRLSEVAPDRTVEKTLSWVDRQVTPSLAVLYEAFDGDFELLQGLILNGADRLTDKHRDMITRFKLKNGMDAKAFMDYLIDQNRQKKEPLKVTSGQ